MKINYINLNNTFTYKNTYKPQKETYKEFDYTKTFNPAEIIGRSQVNFTGKGFEFSDDDKKFIDVLAYNLKMSDKKRKDLENIVAEFLISRDYDSLSKISGEDDEKLEEQDAFLDEMDSVFDFNDYEINEVASVLAERIMHKGKYKPQKRKFFTDYGVVDTILSKNGIKESDSEDIFEIMENEAEINNYKSVFDIFKPENKPFQSITMANMSMNYDLSEDDFISLYIDFALAASKIDEERQKTVDGSKMTRQFENNNLDYTIFDDIRDEYDLDEKLEKEIIAELAKRRDENKDIRQISYELCEKYNLPKNAYKFILESITFNDNYDKLTNGETQE